MTALATRTQQNGTAPFHQTGQRQTPDANLLDLILDQQPTAEIRAVANTLAKSINRLRELLPDNMKSQATRLAKRALLTFAKGSPSLKKCTPTSFVRCVLEAAEYGLVIDGRLAHAVPYWNKNLKRHEAQFQCDYKGIIAVARRKGLIKDAPAAVVCENDHFEAYIQDGKPHLLHQFDVTQERGRPVAAWAMAIFPDGYWWYDVMSIHELNAIKSRTKSRDQQGNITGPWSTDEAEMQKKTVIKRLLKTRSMDLEFDGLLDYDEQPIQATTATKTEAQPVRGFNMTKQDVLDGIEAGAPVDVGHPEGTTNNLEPTPAPAATWQEQWAASCKSAHSEASILACLDLLTPHLRSPDEYESEDGQNLAEQWAQGTIDRYAKLDDERAVKLLGRAFEHAKKIQPSLPSDVWQVIAQKFEDAIFLRTGETEESDAEGND